MLLVAPLFNLQWIPFKELYIRNNHGKIFGFMFLPVRETERHDNFIFEWNFDGFLRRLTAADNFRKFSLVGTVQRIERLLQFILCL